jgi:alpha-beta hydrolase superfamily lysophospholipase
VLTDARPVETTHTQVWFGPEERPLFGWVSYPADGQVRGGVVVCPPFGDEARAAHRTVRRLAEDLAAAGFAALRFDYDGSGDSAGLLDDPDRVPRWLQSVGHARGYLHDLGVTSVSAVGMRLGATLAAVQAADSEPFDTLVCWDPCLSGRTFLRESEALYRLGDRPAPGPEVADPDLRHTPGYHYDGATAKALAALHLGKLPDDVRLAERALLLTRDDRPVSRDVVLTLERGTGHVDTATASDQVALLDVPPEESSVPEEALRDVVAWLTAEAGDRPTEPMKSPEPERAAVVPSRRDGSTSVRERVVRLGPAGLVGIVAEPLDLAERSAAGPVPWVVLVNVAAEHHIGPGRCWVEWSRGWAAAGYRVVRLDQSGVGDSPTPTGRPDDLAFAPEWIDDMRGVVTDLAAEGGKVGIVGLCSGSYSALEVALWEHVDAVFAINPRLTIFQAAKGTHAYTPRRRAAFVPYAPVAALGVRRRLLAGGIWRIWRELAIWYAPLLVLWRVLRRGTALEVVACHDDAQHFTEVYALRPLLKWMRRDKRFRFTADDRVDHSLHSMLAQRIGREQATVFLSRHLPLNASTRPRGRR